MSKIRSDDLSFEKPKPFDAELVTSVPSFTATFKLPEDHAEKLDKVQKFFEQLRDAARAPAYGDHHKQFVANILIRAQEAGIFAP